MGNIVTKDLDMGANSPIVNSDIDSYIEGKKAKAVGDLIVFSDRELPLSRLHGPDIESRIAVIHHVLSNRILAVARYTTADPVGIATLRARVAQAHALLGSDVDITIGSYDDPY